MLPQFGVGQLGSSLLLVLAGIGLIAWILKKFPRIAGLSNGQEGKLKIISVMALGYREKIILIEVEQKKVLLGITSNSIRPLLVLDNKAKTDAQELNL
jgi:flagellar protein FliO/FliZ